MAHGLVNPKFARYHEQNAISDALAEQDRVGIATFMVKPILMPEDAKAWQVWRGSLNIDGNAAASLNVVVGAATLLVILMTALLSDVLKY